MGRRIVYPHRLKWGQKLMDDFKMNISHNGRVNFPTHRVLPRIYKLLLGISRRHGLFTLARFHQYFFSGIQCVSIPSRARLIIPDDPHYFGFRSGIHESHITEVIRSLVHPGDTCLDIGANIGYFSMMMAKVAGPSGRVFAFEPVPETFSTLAMNSALAKGDGLNMTAYQVAISEKVGELAIEIQEHSTYNQVRSIQSEQDAPGRRVKCLTLESFLSMEQLAGPIALIKIDVEGHELSVMTGALPVLKSGQVRKLIIEVTPGEDATKIGEMIAECGAECRVWDGKAWCGSPVKDLVYRTDVLVSFGRVA